MLWRKYDAPSKHNLDGVLAEQTREAGRYSFCFPFIIFDSAFGRSEVQARPAWSCLNLQGTVRNETAGFCSKINKIFNMVVIEYQPSARPFRAQLCDSRGHLSFGSLGTKPNGS